MTEIDRPIIVTLILMPGTPPCAMHLTANVHDKALLQQLLIAGAQEMTRQLAAEAATPAPTDTILLPPGFSVHVPKNPGCN